MSDLDSLQTRKFRLGMMLNGLTMKDFLAPALRVSSVFVLGFIFALIADKFLTIPNIVNVMRQASVLLVLALGMTAVILTGGIDLSIGGTMTLAGCLAAYLMRQGHGIAFAAVIAIAAALVLGMLNGVLIGYVGLPAFVATYGILWIARGLAMVLMQGQIIFGLPSGFRFLGTGHIGPLPVIVIITAVLCLIMHFILSRTLFGLYIYSIGANRNAAYYSGVKTRRVTVAVYGLCAVTAAIAGMLQTARLDAAELAMGDPFLLITIACVMMGGTNMLGGEGGVGGTIIGALILTLIVNGMNLLGVSALAHSLITGIVVIGAVFFDMFVRKVTGRIR